MIDIETEHLVCLHDVPILLPSRSTGRRIHISAIYRWVQRGIRGIRLEVVRIGGTTYTSREALQRFSAQPSSHEEHTPRITVDRQRQIELAARRAHELLNPSQRHRRTTAPPKTTV